MSGRQPKPLAKRALDGNPGKRAFPVGTPDPVLLNEERAAEVRDTVLTSDEARAVWDWIYPAARAARMLTEVDVMSFARYCEAEAWGWQMRKRRRTALAAVDAGLASAEPVQDDEGGDRPGRGLATLQAFALQEKWATESANTAAARLGFDGASRTRIKLDQQLDLFAQDENTGAVVPMLRAVEIAREVIGGVKPS